MPAQASLQAIDQELGKVLNTKVISGLDALRALAVSLVLIDHFDLTEHLLGGRRALGSLGVTIFFVLSGFLITSMLLKEHRKTAGISLTNFYRRRAYQMCIRDSVRPAHPCDPELQSLVGAGKLAFLA